MSEREDELEELLDDTGGSTSGDVDLSELEDDVGGVGDTDGTADVGLDDSELGVDVDALTGEPGGANGSRSSAATESAESAESASASESGSRFRPSLNIGARLRGALGNPLGAVPSPRSFGVALTVTAVFMLGIGGVVPLPGSSLLGVFLGAFLLGAVSDTRRYLPLFVAGALAAGLNVVLNNVMFAFLTGVAPLALFGAGSGAIVGVLGHYFGRDFRDGLTRDV